MWGEIKSRYGIIPKEKYEDIGQRKAKQVEVEVGMKNLWKYNQNHQ
ncbi:uncharacterized protein G2W53_042092 [Senna tora]|uniref:Uncharacterized protein n=1 Tax=Senna tora TaxID=362788 RepID=A0A834SG98_9FABA|nr:uncharacterized protein G2W53_042092 [Senna tora]